MKIGIIGPNTISLASEEDIEARKKLLTIVADLVALSRNEIVLTPDQNSLLEYFGKEYIKNNGSKIWIVAPDKEDDVKDYLNLEIGEIISCERWECQPSKFNRSCDMFICLGYSGGVLSEIGASKYFNPKKILIIEEFISSRLPSEINENIDIEYISLEKLKYHLDLIVK